MVFRQLLALALCLAVASATYKPGYFEEYPVPVVSGFQVAPTHAAAPPRFQPRPDNTEVSVCTCSDPVPKYPMDNPVPKRQDKAPYNKIYTARVTKRIFDLLRDRIIKEQPDQPTEELSPFDSTATQ